MIWTFIFFAKATNDNYKLTLMLATFKKNTVEKSYKLTLILAAIYLNWLSTTPNYLHNLDTTQSLIIHVIQKGHFIFFYHQWQL